MSECLVNGCKLPTGKGGFGYCGAHYRRLTKYGNLREEVPIRYFGLAHKFIEEICTSATQEDCIPWPFTKYAHGYGAIHIAGKRYLAHRIVCEKIHGLPSQEQTHCAHSCGNGHLGCVNPNHLRWATPKENAKDRIAHGRLSKGEDRHNARLNIEKVKEIKLLIKNTSFYMREIAEIYDVSVGTISDIKLGKSWSYVKIDD